MQKKIVPEYLIETDVLSGFLTGSYSAELFVELLSSGVCYTSVLNATELMLSTESESEKLKIKQLLSALKVLGIPGRYALEVGKTGKILALREELMVVLARMNSLVLITQHPLRYEGTDIAIQKFK